MTKHTPGPWNEGTPPGDPSGNRIIYAAYTPVANARSGPERDANARLIAAAPDMLSALHDAVRQIEDLSRTVNVLAEFRKVRAEDYAEKARAAIAKATGEGV